METGKRHNDWKVQQEFERIKQKKSSGTVTATPTAIPGGAAAGKSDKGTPFNLRVQKEGVTIVPATNQLNFTDTLSALWTIVRDGTKAIISVVVDGILPDGTIDQTLRNTGITPKDWVPSSRLKTRHDTAVISTGELGTVEITSVSGDDTPTLYVNGNPANNVATIVSVNTDYQAIFVSTTGNTRPVLQSDAANDVAAVAVNGNCSSGKGVYGWTTTGWGCYGDATSGKALYGTATTGYGSFGVSVDGTGSYGESTNHLGVYGYSHASTGVYAFTDAAVAAMSAESGHSSGIGALGQCNQSNGIGVRGVGTLYGVKGETSSGNGGYFISESGYGVNANSTDTYGVYAVSTTIAGLYAEGGAGIAITANGAVDTNYHYEVAGTRVISAQQPAIANATGLGDVVARLNDVLVAMRTHGLIAT